MLKDEITNAFKSEVERLIAQGHARNEAVAIALKTFVAGMHANLNSAQSSSTSSADDSSSTVAVPSSEVETTMSEEIVVNDTEDMKQSMMSCDTWDSELMLTKVKQFMGSPSLINTVFVQDASSDSLSVDKALLEKFYDSVVKLNNNEVLDTILSYLEVCSESLLLTAHAVESYNDMIFIIVALDYPLILDPIVYRMLRNIFIAMEKLPEHAMSALSYWMGEEAGVTRYCAYVEGMRQYLTLKLLNGEIEDGKVVGRAMNLLYVQYDRMEAKGMFARQGISPSFTFREFYNDTLNDDLLKANPGKRNEYSLWMLDNQKGRLVLRQRELEEEKRILSIHHDQQQRYLREQQRQQEALTLQKQELVALQEQLQHLEETRPVSSTPEQIQELTQLQQRLRQLDANLAIQRASINLAQNLLQRGVDTSTTSSAIEDSPLAVPRRVLLPIEGLTADTAALTLWERLPFVKRESFVSYSFLLTPSSKTALLEAEIAADMANGFENDIRQARMLGLTHIIPYFVLQVRRDHIVMDTINKILAVTMIAETMFMSDNSDANRANDTREKYRKEVARQLKKPLKVIFDGEEGVDAGGVRKEYYQILTKQLLDPNYGMFHYHEQSRLLWFNAHSFENDQEYELIGTMIGMFASEYSAAVTLCVGIAIYNSIILDLRMPMAVYKKLLGRKCTLEDLTQLEPSVGHSLRRLLETTDAAEVASLGLAFEISTEVFGEKRVIPLTPDGSNTPVTVENKAEFVRLYVDYLLETSIQHQFSAFARGFRMVCNAKAMETFRFEELELLINGNPVLNFEALKAGTLYEDGYTATSAQVVYFWDIVLKFSEEEKRKLLKFVTGSDRAPIDGLGSIRLVISKTESNDGNPDARLPSAHTCFNHLLLPAYSQYHIMREKLLYAMEHDQGFGLR